MIRETAKHRPKRQHPKKETSENWSDRGGADENKTQRVIYDSKLIIAPNHFCFA